MPPRLPWSASRCTSVALAMLGVYDLGLAVLSVSMFAYPPASSFALVIAIVVVLVTGSALIALRGRIPSWLGLRPQSCSPARAREDFLVAALAMLAIFKAQFSVISLALMGAAETAGGFGADTMWQLAMPEAAALNVWLLLLLGARRLARWLYRRKALQRAAY